MKGKVRNYIRRDNEEEEVHQEAELNSAEFEAFNDERQTHTLNKDLQTPVYRGLESTAKMLPTLKTNEINLDHDIAGEFEAAIDQSKMNSINFDNAGSFNYGVPNEIPGARQTGSIMGGDSRVFSTPRYN